MLQAASALEKISELIPSLKWEQINLSSPGDRDRKTDLMQSPGDFFSRDLDDAVLNGELDCATHSAKDLEYPMREGIDWVWLPWREEPEDVLICRPGFMPEELTKDHLIGVSSGRREDYCIREFPEVPRQPIRGNIEDRLAQLDEGRFDMILMAKAALNRLGLSGRITRVLSLKELPVPEAQGVLALTFRAGDSRFEAIRSLFVKSVRFVGSGPGDAALCTLRGVEALKNCDVCFYDSLIDDRLLSHVHGETVYTGKRSGHHSLPQEKISALISEYARKGLSVVRLKGGDPGIFGRLAEEVEELEKLKIPYRVIPGVSSLNAATTGTGMLLTRREVSRGYTAMSSRVKDGGIADTGAEARGKLPVVFFMSLKAAPIVIQSLKDEGRPASEPAAVVYNAGAPDQKIIRGTLTTLPGLIEEEGYARPGLLIAGEISSYGFDMNMGALEGKKILLTCSERLMERACRMVEDLGGIPLPSPLIKLERTLETLKGPEENLESCKWVVLTSPSAIEFFMELVKQDEIDLRTLPKIMVCGTPSRQKLMEYGIHADLCPPASYGAEELKKAAAGVIKEGDRVLRLRSAAAGDEITRALESLGAQVTDRVLYRNSPVPPPPECPESDAVFFASSSAIRYYEKNWGSQSFENRILLAIGEPTARTIRELYGSDPLIAKEADIPSSIMTLAAAMTERKLKETV